MGIFDIFKPQPSKIQRYTFMQAPHYKGFKTLPFSVFGEKDAEQNNERMKDIDLTGATISLEPSARYYNVFLNGQRIGSIYDDNLIKTIPNIKEAYIKPVSESVVDGKKITERHRFKLFVRRES